MIRKLESTMMLILIKIPAIISEAYTSFGSLSKLTIRLAAGCCFVFSIFISLLLSEKKATSAPEIVNVSNNNTIKSITSKVAALWSAARKIKESLVHKKLNDRMTLQSKIF